MSLVWCVMDNHPQDPRISAKTTLQVAFIVIYYVVKLRRRSPTGPESTIIYSFLENNSSGADHKTVLWEKAPPSRQIHLWAASRSAASSCFPPENSGMTEQLPELADWELRSLPRPPHQTSV